jgi:hypothetical protein
MEVIQSLDPGGGVIYALSESGSIPDFAQAPSAAGTTWLLMVQRTIADARVNEMFWGTDPGAVPCHELYLPAVIRASP